MGFVQIIEFHTSKIDDMRKLDQDWDQKAGPETTARRGVLCEDRDNPGRFFQVVFFDSYESAMQNSQLPETQSFSGEMQKLGDGPPTFYNPDVIEDRS